jgi:transcriptional regulator with XRE-family HTH domain
LSQLDLAAEVEMSTRHLSFVETGRSQPSRVMVLRLAERLSVPLRERNALLIAAGFAPMYSQHAFSDPSMAAARAAVDLILTGHEPYPALLIDRYWMLVAANRIVAPMLAGVDESLLAPPMNMLRISLHPAGLAPRIANLTQWREHVLGRVQRDFELTADERLGTLLEELRAYPPGDGSGGDEDDAIGGIVVPLKLHSPAGLLTLFSTTTVFGTAVEVTLSELMLEAFYPADEFTAQVLRAVAGAVPGNS